MDTIIKINVTPWVEAALRDETFPQTWEELAKLAASRDYTPRQMAQYAIAGREVGRCPPDIIDENIELLAAGGTLAVDTMIARVKLAIEINGKEIQVRKYSSDRHAVEEGMDIEGNPPVRGNFAIAGTPESARNARLYLERNVPGHIYNRLVQLRYAGEDIRGPVEKLFATVMGYVEELENGKSKPE